jgi:hypothetical protein
MFARPSSQQATPLINQRLAKEKMQEEKKTRPYAAPVDLKENQRPVTSEKALPTELEKLRKHKAYEIANDSKHFSYQCIVMGREIDLLQYKESKYYAKAKLGNEFFLAMNSNAEGDDWSFEWNMAFWLGGIEANKTFILCTDITEVLSRARKYRTFHPPSIGGTVAELLWLFDNGYTFSPCLHNIALTIATPPEQRVTPLFLRTEYNKFNQEFAEDNIHRLADLSNYVVQCRNSILTQQAFGYNPT